MKVLLLGAVACLVLLGCGEADSAGTEADAAADVSTTAPVPTTSEVFRSPAIDPSVPDDPAELVTCEGLDAAFDRYAPARWLPTDLPEGQRIAVGATTIPGEANQLDGWETHLWADGGGTAVGSNITVSAEERDTDGAEYDDVYPATLRGHPGSLGPSRDRGSGGSIVARWWEDGVSWSVEAWQVSADRLAAFIERAELAPRAVADPQGEFTVVSSGPLRQGLRTEIELVSGDEYGGRRNLVIVVEPVDPSSGPSWVAPTPDLSLGEFDGRPAWRGGVAGLRGLATTTADGERVVVQGDFTDEELEALVRSITRVESDDPRLAGLPLSWVAGEQTYCRLDS